MPQEHHVLRCFSCGTFQVHIVKKAPKWSCKMCGAKQSLKRNYGKGSGKDCRNQVMRLNELRVLKGESGGPVEIEGVSEEAFAAGSKEQESAGKKSLNSKWAEYLDEKCESQSSENEDSASEGLSEAAEKRKRRKRASNSRSNKKRKSFTNESSVEEGDKVNERFFAEVSSDTSGGIANKGRGFTEKGNCKSKSKYTKYLDDDEANDCEEEENK